MFVVYRHHAKGHLQRLAVADDVADARVQAKKISRLSGEKVVIFFNTPAGAVVRCCVYDKGVQVGDCAFKRGGA
jgi:hypothetical protein